MVPTANMSEASREEAETRAARALIESGSDLAGAVSGAAIGLIGGPPGAIGGAASGVLVSRVLRHVGREIVTRLVGPEQSKRMGAAFTFAAADIREQLDAGKQPRTDDWFESTFAGRPAAEEILEGVLLNAADAYEERKVRYLGRLYAGFAFDDSVDRADANLLITLFRRLTYRELALIAALGSGWLREYASHRRGDPVFVNALPGPLAELEELGQIGVAGFQQQDGYVAAPVGTLGGGNVRAWSLHNLVLTPVGDDLYHLAGLNDLPRTDQNEVLERLVR